MLAVGLLCGTAGDAAAGATIDIPELGTKRRVVMAAMRMSGHRLLDGSGERLDFNGGPVGLERAIKSSYRFSGVTLDDVMIDFGRAAANQEERQFYRSVRRQLVTQYGGQWHGTARTTAGRVVRKTTWRRTDSRVTLRSLRNGRVIVRIRRHQGRKQQQPVQAPVFERAMWSPSQYNPSATRAKIVAEELLAEFGDQRVISQGARRKGAPIGVRLKTIEIPANAVGIDSYLIHQRFIRFIKGYWEVALARTRRRADVDLELKVVPTLHNGSRGFAMQLEARALNGRGRGRVLYSATRRI